MLKNTIQVVADSRFDMSLETPIKNTFLGFCRKHTQTQKVQSPMSQYTPDVGLELATQSCQKSLIKKYTLNQIGVLNMI